MVKQNDNRQKLPPWVPIDIAQRVDPCHFNPYEGEVARDAEMLSAKLRVNIAAYNAVRAVEHNGAFQLCRFYRMASLTPRGIHLLKAVERRHRGTLFVAYHQPLQPIDNMLLHL